MKEESKDEFRIRSEISEKLEPQKRSANPGRIAPFQARGSEINGVQQGFFETPDHLALRYRLYGHGDPTLILCDGIGCDGFIWKYFIPFFSSKVRILHWQYRGHGRSSVPKDFKTLTIEHLAQDLNHLLGFLRCKPAVLLGHSMGSQVVLEFHRQFPQQVRGLISICGAPGNALDGFLNTKRFRYLFPYLLQFFRTAPRVSEFLWKSFLAKPESYYTAILLHLTSTLCSKEDLLPYLEHLGRIEPRLFMELARNMAVHSTKKHLAQIRVPTLVLAGDRDTFTPLKHSKIIVHEVPQAEFMIIRGGTHTAPLELPDLIHLRIQKFLHEHFGVFR